MTGYDIKVKRAEIGAMTSGALLPHPPTLVGTTFETLRQRILSGELADGTPLNSAALVSFRKLNTNRGSSTEIKCE